MTETIMYNSGTEQEQRCFWKDIVSYEDSNTLNDAGRDSLFFYCKYRCSGFDKSCDTYGGQLNLRDVRD